MPRTVFAVKTLSWGGWNYDADSLKDVVVGTFMTDCLKPLVAHASENMYQIIPYQLSVVLKGFAVPVLEVRIVWFVYFNCFVGVKS